MSDVGTQTVPPNSTVPLAPVLPVAPVAPAPQGTGQRYYTEAELNAERERIRQEEHAKLYPELGQWKTRAEQLEAAQKARDEADAKAAADAQAAAEAEEIRKRTEEMSIKEQLSATERELKAQLAEETRKREAMEALWQREAQFNELRTYRQQVLDANKDNIFPSFWEELTGPEGDLLSSREEIEARAAKLVARTQQTLGEVAQAQQQERREAPGVSSAAPGSGFDPMAQLDQQSQTLTADDIKNMTAAEYAKLRPRLPTGRSGVASGQGRGILD